MGGKALAPLPMSVISGYLGAGKTTLINALLANPSGRIITVLVNDFGEIAIDASLIQNQSGDTITLTNGCVCCTLGGDLYDAIDCILASRPRPDWLILETSGVADPARIMQIAVAEPDLTPARTVTLIDGLNFLGHMGDHLLYDSLARQARSADILILSKSDIARPAEQDRLLEALAALAPGVPVRVAPKIADIVESILRLPPARDNSPQNQPALVPENGPDHHHGAQYATWHYRGEGRATLATLKQASEPETSGCLRLKGHLLTPDGERWLVHRAGGQWSAIRAPDDAEPPRTELVAIGLEARFRGEILQAVFSGQ